MHMVKIHPSEWNAIREDGAKNRSTAKWSQPEIERVRALSLRYKGREDINRRIALEMWTKSESEVASPRREMGIRGIIPWRRTPDRRKSDDVRLENVREDVLVRKRLLSELENAGV